MLLSTTISYIVGRQAKYCGVLLHAVEHSCIVYRWASGRKLLVSGCCVCLSLTWNLEYTLALSPIISTQGCVLRNPECC